MSIFFPPGAAGGGSQTPWTTDIDAAGFSIKNIAIIYAADGVSPLIDLTGTLNPSISMSFDSNQYPHFSGGRIFIADGGSIGHLVLGDAEISKGPGVPFGFASGIAVTGETSLANGATTIDSSGNLTAASFTGGGCQFGGAGGHTVIDDSGNLSASTLSAGNGFTGSGLFTNFTIANGIVTNAS